MDNWFKHFRPRYYKLLGTHVVPVDDMMEWARWFNTTDRHVDIDRIQGNTISTVFLGLDHRIYTPPANADPTWLASDTAARANTADPLVFETMIFPENIWHYYQTRCSTYEQAINMHKIAVDHVRRVQRQLPIIIEEKANG